METVSKPRVCGAAVAEGVATRCAKPLALGEGPGRRRITRPSAMSTSERTHASQSGGEVGLIRFFDR
jgi:hypothetical protein